VPDTVTHYSEATVRSFMQRVFEAQQVPGDDARLVSEVLVAADLKGLDTHGLSRLAYYRERLQSGVTRPVTELEVVHETPTTAVLDAHHGMGHVVGVRAMQMAVHKAGHHGLGSVAVRNSTHYGIAGYYAEMAVNEKMVGLTSTNARPSVVPTFSTEPKFGTNPLAFGAPTDEPCPFIYDASMAVIQRGKIEVARRSGKKMPDGVIINDTGQSLHDPADILEAMKTGRAAMLPLGGRGEDLGGHKGYGLSIILEILSAALQGGAFLSGLAGGDCGGEPRTYNLGHFFLAINPEAFGGIDSFRATTGAMLRELRSARREPGAERVWTAGEKEWETERHRREHGIPVSPELLRELNGLADDLGIERIGGAGRQDD
jgi:LDH2 family malate/lactate/ureidoglycolate dehydrogenase